MSVIPEAQPAVREEDAGADRSRARKEADKRHKETIKNIKKQKANKPSQQGLSLMRNLLKEEERIQA